MDGWILFEICVNLFQGALMVYFMRRHVHACRGNRLTDAACTAAVGLFFTAHQYFAFSFTDFYFSVFLLQKERSILPNSYDQDSVELIAQFYR